MKYSIFLLAFLLISCGGAKPEIGVILPLSGSAEADGSIAKRGLELFISEMGEVPPCNFVIVDNACELMVTFRHILRSKKNFWSLLKMMV